MRRTHNEAIEILTRTGDAAAAWSVAQQDEGLNEGVTMDQWVAYARSVIAQRAQTAAAYASPSFND